MRHKNLLTASISLLLTVQTTSAKPRDQEVGKTFRITPEYETEQDAHIFWKFTPTCPSNDADCISTQNQPQNVARRMGRYSWFIYAEFKNKVQQDDTNDLILINPSLSSSGRYELEVLPANNAEWKWGPEIIEMFKRPNSPIEIKTSESYRDNNEHAISNGRKQTVATCVASGAKPAARLQWQWEGAGGSEVLASNPRQNLDSNGEVTTELDLSLTVSSDMNKKVFTCVATQPGIPVDSIERVATFGMQVKFSPENLKLVIVESKPDDSGSSVRKVRCSASANPKPRFNFTLPNGTSQPPRGQSPEQIFYETVYDEMNPGAYECSACNKIDESVCRTVRKTSSELMSDGNDGDTFLLHGLSIWVWVVIVAGLLVASGVAVMFCCCKSGDGRKSGRKSYKQGGVSKADISRPMNLPPDGQSDRYDSMASRHKLIPTRKASDDGDGASFQGATIVQTAQDAIGGNDDNSGIHEHLRFIQQQQDHQQQTHQYLNKSKEMLNDEQIETGLPAGVSDANELHRNNYEDPIRYNGTAYFDQPPPQPIVTSSDLQQAQIRNQFPRASGNSHASNRPYSQHFGYGNPSSSGVNTNTLPNQNSQRSTDPNAYGSQFGYGSSANAAGAQMPVPSARSMGNLAGGQQGTEQYAETTLI